eukprot:7432875-Prorocentrum_lima.AAC.1
MTSSLVGSEMCIRDRASVEGPPQLLCWWCGRAGAPPPPPSPVPLWPVSYTHLTLPTICSV